MSYAVFCPLNFAIGVRRYDSGRDDEATRNLPVVMMTTSPGMSASDRSAIDQLGASVLLHKPSSAEELAELIGHGLTKGPG